MNPQEPCLDVGFYFVRASGHSFNLEKRKILETNLRNLGISLSDGIRNDSEIRARYNSLFDFGFTSYSKSNFVLPEEWCDIIRIESKNSQLITKIYPNADFEIIENSLINLCVSQVMFLMSLIKADDIFFKSKIIKPLTPEQRAKEAERIFQIGFKGEVLILENEYNKLKTIKSKMIPKHVALESTHYGYDILSYDEKDEEIFIEVKTTTRQKKDPDSKRFFLSNNEYENYLENKGRYRLYRVYDIENEPIFEELSLEYLKKKPDGYIVEY